jgi:Rod binding domain-containing protein
MAMETSTTINDSLSHLAADSVNLARTRGGQDVLGGEFAHLLSAKRASNDALKQFQDTAGDRNVGTDREKVRAAAEQLVASTFILPLLAQMRDSPFKSELLHGGKGEDAFGAQLDTQFADRIVQSGNFKLVDQIEQQMLRQSSQLKASPSLL